MNEAPHSVFMKLSKNLDSSSRLAARLRRLPHDKLADLAAALAGMSLVSAKRLADAVLAEHDPVSEVFVNGIFQTPEIVACILSSVDPGAPVAMVCNVWTHEWQAIVLKRRFLRPAPLADLATSSPQVYEVLTKIGASRPGAEFFMCSPPSGAWLCCTYENGGARIIAPSMLHVHSIARFPDALVQGCAASEDRIYLSAGGNPDVACRVVAFQLDGQATGIEHVCSDEDQAFALAVGRDVAVGREVLFAIVLQDHRHGKIVALDAHSLEHRCSFGGSLFHTGDEEYYSGRCIGGRISSLTVAGDVLYVTDTLWCR